MRGTGAKDKGLWCLSIVHIAKDEERLPAVCMADSLFFLCGFSVNFDCTL